MVGMTPNRLPSNSKVKDMNVERLVCAQKQIAEDLVDSENLCLMSDETSKYGKKYQGFHLSDSSGSQWVLGVRELHSKSAVDVMSSFKEVLDDIGHVAKVSEETTSQRLLYNITSTMSDKAATEAKFHSLLEEYRKDVLPTVVDNFHCMNENEQECVSRLHNFFCGIHSIVHLAEGASAALVETEKGFFLDERPIMDKSFLKKTESGTARLIRTASKAVARGGDESAGCQQQFMDSISAFRKQHKLTSLPLEPYRGHRFNILFSNAAALFFIHRILLDFLNTFQNNRLLKAVLFDLKVPEYLAGVKALGLVSKFLTEPLWSMIERKDNHILDMNNNYSKVVSFLTDAAMNPTKLMSGDLLVFGERTQIRKDGMYYSLLERWDHDDKVESILGVMLGTLTKVAQHQFRDHLADGKLETLATDADVRKQTKSVPTHNKFSETVFGFFDQLVRARPSITPLVSESYILYSFNKTSEWLHGKDDTERQDILKFARENVVKTRAKFKERQREIEIARLKKMEERRKKEEDLAARRVAKIEPWAL